MSVSKTGVILFMLVFFFGLSSLIGLFEQATYYDIEETDASIIERGKPDFFPAIISGYKELPSSLNILIFGSLGITTAWVFFSTLPTFSGGS